MLSNALALIVQTQLHGDYEEALNLVKIRHKVDLISGLPPEQIEQLYNFGYHLSSAGLWESALPVFIALTKRVPDYEPYWRALGLAHYALKSYPKALNALEEAVKLNPDDTITLVYSAELLLLTGKIQAGCDTLQGVLEKNQQSGSKDPFLIRARSLLQRNAPKK